MAGQATAAAAASALRCYNALLGGPCGIAEQRPMRDVPLFRPASAALSTPCLQKWTGLNVLDVTAAKVREARRRILPVRIR